jgi:DNA polymerase III epsilon subunit-like protein
MEELPRAYVIDTETTGLVTEHEWFNLLTTYQYHPQNLPTVLAKLPHILQISAFYSPTRSLFDEYVEWTPSSNGFPIECIQWHGIRERDLKRKGRPITQVLRLFLKGLIRALHNHVPIVGHNVKFDLRMVLIEVMRIGDKKAIAIVYQTLITPSKQICTMEYPVSNKYPKLVELYTQLFDVVPNNLHDSLIDVLVCYRCFAYLTQNIDIAYTKQFRETFTLLNS